MVYLIKIYFKKKVYLVLIMRNKTDAKLIIFINIIMKYARRVIIHGIN